MRILWIWIRNTASNLLLAAVDGPQEGGLGKVEQLLPQLAALVGQAYQHHGHHPHHPPQQDEQGHYHQQTVVSRHSHRQFCTIIYTVP